MNHLPRGHLPQGIKMLIRQRNSMLRCSLEISLGAYRHFSSEVCRLILNLVFAALRVMPVHHSMAPVSLEEDRVG
jgi:hypothetical protein